MGRPMFWGAKRWQPGVGEKTELLEDHVRHEQTSSDGHECGSRNSGEEASDEPGSCERRRQRREEWKWIRGRANVGIKGDEEVEGLQLRVSPFRIKQH